MGCMGLPNEGTLEAPDVVAVLTTPAGRDPPSSPAAFALSIGASLADDDEPVRSYAGPGAPTASPYPSMCPSSVVRKSADGCHQGWLAREAQLHAGSVRRSWSSRTPPSSSRSSQVKFGSMPTSSDTGTGSVKSTNWGPKAPVSTATVPRRYQTLRGRGVPPRRTSGRERSTSGSASRSRSQTPRSCPSPRCPAGGATG